VQKLRDDHLNFSSYHVTIAPASLVALDLLFFLAVYGWPGTMS
jgi:hypothetical protein